MERNRLVAANLCISGMAEASHGLVRALRVSSLAKAHGLHGAKAKRARSAASPNHSLAFHTARPSLESLP